MSPRQEVERTLDLNRFLLFYYWGEREFVQTALAAARHVRLLFIRARVGAR